jgi:hypothetical protein
MRHHHCCGGEATRRGDDGGVVGSRHHHHRHHDVVVAVVCGLSSKSVEVESPKGFRIFGAERFSEVFVSLGAKRFSYISFIFGIFLSLWIQKVFVAAGLSRHRVVNRLSLKAFRCC